MKNQYVGDVRDFGKYGLLRQLAGMNTDSPLKLGVNWYLTPDDTTRNGAHTSYLELPPPNPYVAADSQLVERLRTIVRHQGRDVQHVAAEGVLPDGTAYFNQVVLGRADHRQRWLEEGLEVTADCDLIFLDPDNGLDSPTQSEARSKPPHATVNEVAQYISRGQSVVVIQFFSRVAKHAEQVQRRLAQIAPVCEEGGLAPFGMLWRVHPALLFLVAPASVEHAALLRARAASMVQTAWGHFFSPPVELVTFTD